MKKQKDLLHFFAPFSNLSNPGTILNWVALIVLTGQVVLLIIFLQSGQWQHALILGLGTLPTLTTLALVRAQAVQAGAVLLFTSMLALVTALATTGQGIFDPAVMSFPAILIVTSLIVKRRVAIVLFIVSLLSVGWLVFGDVLQLYQPQYPHRAGFSHFAVAVLVLILTLTAVQVITNALRVNAERREQELIERKKVETALREAEELYRSLVENTSVITYRDSAEPVSQTNYISPQIVNVLGYSQEEWQADPLLWTKCTHPEDLPSVLAQIEGYLQTGGNSTIEYRMQAKDGRWVWFQDESVVLTNEQGRPKYIHGVLTDITERKQAEQKLRQREAILSAVAETAQLLLRAYNWRDEVNEILRVLGEATGASHVYIFQNHLGADGVMLSSMKYEWAAPGMKTELNNPVYQDTRLIPLVPGLEDWYNNLSAGQPFYGSGQQYPRYWKKVFGPQGLKTLLDVPIMVNRQFWGIIGFDDYLEEMRWSQAEIDALVAAAGNLGTAISRQQTDASLRASEEKFQLAFHHTFVPMLISNATTQVILDVNDAFCKGTGYTREEIIGKTPTELRIWLREEDQLRHKQVLEQFGYEEEFKAGFRRKSGEAGVALISGVTIRLDDEVCLLHTVYDISKIDQLLKELEAKNEELQSFTYTVSHDLRAPLITISGFLGYLNQDFKSGKVDKVERDVERISEAVAKMDRLLRELLELSRVGRITNPPESVSFNEVAQEALQAVEGRLKAGNIQVRVQAGLPEVYGDRVRLVEVLQNLLDNAAKFMGNQPQPQIEVGCIQADGTPTFYVRDNGIGIDPEQQERVFGLFNKLDARSEGTGIGLALVRRIVEIHGGRVWIESQGMGHGTTFWFTLANPPKDS